MLKDRRMVSFCCCIRFAYLLAVIQLASATGVCYRDVSSTETYQVYVSMSSGYTTRCGLFWRCDRTRYRAAVQLRTRIVHRIVPVCCNGYQGNGVDCTPICTGDCSNRGTCVAPEVCDCQDGWTGNQCSEDFDECAAGVCTNCTNSVGSFQCTCPDGITLSPGQTCVDPPGMISTSHITSRSILISWEAPTITQQDEHLQNYALSCSASGTSHTEAPMTIESSETSVTVPNLAPNTIYTCCIRAITTAGQSPNVCTRNSTLEDGILIIHLNV
ncbi:Epidermal growth factor-like protein 8 [Geodia barretti]|uniref:Epidermal growth factor-like protein 8 n=1 Tax=Geodia barretti TaxID=519541 RepID=A0AA35WRF2_GEOBA|nr:Epidermal growth factor-like protein 8 [Geodia barretti]